MFCDVLWEASVTVGLTRKRILSALALALVMLGGFAFGFVSCLHLKSVASSDLRHQYLLQTGDAPASVRAEVLAALRAFQEGYIRRDPKELDSFMYRLFPVNDDILLLGTDADEWVRGYRPVAEFIREDWLTWGDFRFAVDDSIVWSAGDVAWIASVGVVHDQRADRPLRFSAILIRHGHNWLFRQVHFQWDDRDPRPSDVLRKSTYLKLVRWVLQYIRG
jgi:SnoaL-like domain